MIDEIRGPLEKICGAVDGALAATVMGFDGVAVDTYEHAQAPGEAEVPSLLIEYSTLLDQVRRSAQMFAAGELEELSIRAENVTALIRPLNEEYFLALALTADSGAGKGRYLLRLHAPRLAEFLG